ncbi:MAG: cellulose biosynthesis cyclic di-GMP-binding regulatory protein BcsB, partial [Acetobacteraceae bacterium]|nr:cellulose biosynthesis cyclic di-GMP-binding regulatory protein BcsB [Acetobacteraceae bacterium]
RTAFRDFAESCGAGYIIRPDNKHAKAGNLNHALARTDGEFITIFDCDHIPTRAFLQMSMGWMVQNERLAAIQTPHHFYSPDPFQRNLAAGTRVPSEGNMFYGLVQDGNDFWDAAFFCGSCAVIRRKALEDIGGFATETVTEDAHTALRLHRAGWESAYLKLPLAAGLATERLILHIGQRVRWARGMIQILRLENPLFGPGLRLGQRLCYFNAMAHFLFAIPRIVFLTSPLAFLLLGQNIIAASPLAIVAYALPHIFHSVATNSRIQRNWRHSFWSEIYETVLALFLVRVTLITLLNPRRGRFNVTDKGGILDNGYFDMRAVYPNILLALILFVGFSRGIYGLCFQSNDALTFQALLLNTIWVVLSLLIVLAALAVGRETRQLRLRARVRAKLPAVMWLPDGRTVQAVSRDLSLGGGSLIVERPEGVADDAAVHVEFRLGADLVTIPARVLQWDGSLLQLSWQAGSVAEESKVVQVVFGRADAWVDWDQFPIDRPFASLWTVLVSIRGLFRPRGRVLQEPALLAEIEAARTARTSTAILAKQTLVLRPPAAMARMAVVLGLMLVMPMLANAEQGRTTVRPIPQPIPQMMQTQSAGAAPSSASPPAPTIPDQEVPAPQTAPSTPTGQVVLTLHQLGAQGPMTMRGTSALQGVVFGVHSDEVVTGAQLNLSGAMSPAMIPDLSNVTVMLNEQYVGTIPVNRDQPQYSGLSLQVNPVFFQESNRLNFRFTGRYTQDCNDPLSGLLWATVSDTSTLALTLARLPAQHDLSRLPLPFIDKNVKEAAVLPFVLPADPANETLQGAAIVASWFGEVADFRGTTFPVSNDLFAEGNMVVVGIARQLPPALQLSQISGPTLAVVANPSDPYGSILVVTGRTGAEVVAAATTLSIGARTLSGDRAIVSAPNVAPRRPYDAPAWIPTDRPVKLGELVEASDLQGSGYVPGTFHVPFRTAPDLYTWRRRAFEANIHFRAPPGPIIDVASSRLDVGINGMFLRSYPLASNDQALDWLQRIFGTPVGASARSTAVPPWMV